VVLIRWYLPKCTDSSKIAPEQIARIEYLLAVPEERDQGGLHIIVNAGDLQIENPADEGPIIESL